MAEVEEAIEMADEAIGGAEEGLEELPEAVREEIAEEVAEVQEEVSELSRIQSTLKQIIQSAPKYIGKLIAFTVKNVAIGGILWGVTVALNKLLPHGDQELIKRKLAVVKALNNVIKTITDMSHSTVNWLKEHENDTITLDGVEVPMESVLQKYLIPISNANDEAAAAAKNLQDQIKSSQFTGPDVGEIGAILAAEEASLHGYIDLVTFISQHQNILQPQSFPVNQYNISTLSSQIQYVKALPLW